MDQKTLFLKTPPHRLFLRAALPGSVGMLASSLYQLMDGIFVGRILGDEAFAALNLAMPLVIINFALADLIGVGSAVPISVRLGEKRNEEAHNLFTCACLMVVGLGALTGAVLYALAPALLGWMGAEGELARLGVQYMRVYALCSPVVSIVFAADNYLRICGRIKTSMVLNVLMSALCAGLEFFFLYVMRLGIAGAALGTCLGMMVCAVLAMGPFFTGRMPLHFVRPRFTRHIIGSILSCGCPTFLSNIAGRVTSILMNMVLLRLGGAAAVSVYGILMYVDGFVLPLLYGMCDSLQPAVGYNWGAGRRDRVLAIEKRCFAASALISLAAAGLLLAFPTQTAGLFVGPSDTAMLALAVPAVQLFSLGYLTRWFSFAAQSFLSAVEKPLQASILSVSVALVFPVLLIAILWPLGLTGLWCNQPGTALLAGLLAVVLLLDFRRRYAART